MATLISFDIVLIYFSPTEKKILASPLVSYVSDDIFLPYWVF